MPSKSSVTEWIEAIKAGDQQAAQKLWERYCGQLVRLARKQLGSTSRRVADEEDVAIIAFDAFCRAAKQGRFPQLSDRDDLWRLLVTITARKAAEQIKVLGCQKRGGRKNKREPASQADHPIVENSRIDQVIDNRPTPEFAALAAEQFRRLLGQLDDTRLCQVALWKMEGYSNDEIAEQLDCSLRTVERKLRLIRTRWSRR